jgi:hypothetical protein
MKPQGPTLNKPGSKHSSGPILYDLVLFKMGATDQTLNIAHSKLRLRGILQLLLLLLQVTKVTASYSSNGIDV